jgi:ribosomal protein S7
MKKQKLKKSAIAATIALAVSMGAAMSVSAETAATLPGSPATPESKESLETKRNQLAERQQKAPIEALEAIAGTQNALIALQNNDTGKAMAVLQDVSGKLDVLLAKYPGLTLIPANIEADVDDFDGDPKEVDKIVDEAARLLKDHKVQDARSILSDLVSEMRITTTSIPLGTFPAAIKDAVKLIDQGKKDEAEDALYDVLNLLVKTVEIIPLPVLKAEALVTAASELEHKSDLTQEASRSEILKLTDAAKEKLKLAEMLGYGDKADYKQLYEAIDGIKDVIHSEKSAAFWDKIKNSLSALKNKIMHPGK